MALNVLSRWLSRQFFKHSRNKIQLTKYSLLIGTKNGLYYLSENRSDLILPGEFYGIAVNNNQFWVFQKKNSQGQILYYSDRINNQPQIILNGLSPGCHQIEYYNQELYITDTYNNCIIKYNLSTEKMSEYYPLGKLLKGRESENYGHINSITFHKDKVYVLAHNETKKTGKNSRILVLNHNLELTNIIDTISKNAHNIVFYQGNLLVCNSLNQTLLVNNKNKEYHLATFTRGLEIVGDNILVGGSDYSERKKRSIKGGHIILLDEDYKNIDRIRMPGMVQEIRKI